MDEIEKLYENAGVEYYDKYFSCKKDEDLTCQDNCEICDNAEEVKCYPPFTAEKQLEIENVLLQNKKHYNKWIEYNINVYGEWVIRFVKTDKFAPYIALEKTRAEAIANLVNKIWQDLTEEEKQQVRNILNE